MNPALIAALAGALLHFLWEGAALALLLAVALLIFRDPRVRYALAGIVLFAMPVVFIVTAAIVYPHASQIPGHIQLTRFPPASIVYGSPLANAKFSLATAQHLMQRFVPFWFAGIVLLYLRGALSWIAVRRIRSTSVAAVSAEWGARLAILAKRLGIERAVKLLESQLVDVPVVAGFLRPVILMPAGCFANMPAEQIEYLLIHELAHVRRLDYLTNLLQKAIEGLLFYHPAVWWVSSVMRREREHCCDDVVLSLHPEPRNYAQTLANLEQTRWTALPAANGGDLNTRIRRILGMTPAQHLAPAAILSVLLVTASAFLMIAAMPRFASAQDPANAGPYERWVKDDIAYIITSEERSAYKNLQRDEERKHFIEQFWLRRDPTPGTPENEYKDEHYRRIAYANQKFTSSIPGWKTDRGRIYITYGPPDEIDSHPSCGVNALPYDLWKYRFIEGIGQNVLIEFDDPGCTGEYRMTLDPQRARP